MRLFDFFIITRTDLRIAVLTASLIISFTSLHAQLSGTKTIGPGGDYQSFTAAVAALTSQDVSGAVWHSCQIGWRRR